MVKQKTALATLKTSTKYSDEAEKIKEQIPELQTKHTFYKKAAAGINLKNVKQFKTEIKETPIYKDEVVTYCTKHEEKITSTSSSLKCLTKDNSHTREVCGPEGKTGKCVPFEVQAAALCMEWVESGTKTECKRSEVVLPKRECTTITKDGPKCEYKRIIPASFFCKEKFENGHECRIGGLVYGPEKYEVVCAKKNSDGLCYKYNAQLKTGHKAGVYEDLIIVQAQE